MSERIYRDPVHNIIRLQTDSDEGELMMRLIDAAEFQRLRRIKQLGLGLYTYQGAEHSRFTHSLGAFHLMTRVLDRLGERYAISLLIERRACCCTAARRGPWILLARDGEGAQLSSRTMDRRRDLDESSRSESCCDRTRRICRRRSRRSSKESFNPRHWPSWFRRNSTSIVWIISCAIH